MRRKEPGEKQITVSTTLHPTLVEEIRALAAERHQQPAQVIRDLIQAGYDAQPGNGRSVTKKSRAQARQSSHALSVVTRESLTEALNDDAVITGLLEQIKRRRREEHGSHEPVYHHRPMLSRAA